MRTYGKVATAFWTDSRTRRLSERAKLLALYLLTGPHSNAIGVFRLGAGAISDDFEDWSRKEILAALGEMDGWFIVREDGWVQIRNYLRAGYNPPENGKVMVSMWPLINPCPPGIKRRLGLTLKPFVEKYRSGISEPSLSEYERLCSEAETEVPDTPFDDEEDTVPDTLPDTVSEPVSHTRLVPQPEPTNHNQPTNTPPIDPPQTRQHAPGTKAGAKPPDKPAARSKRCSHLADLEIDEELLRIACENGKDAAVEIENYRDWLAKNGKRHKDYRAGFRNWLRSPYGKPHRPAQAGGILNSLQDSLEMIGDYDGPTDFECRALH